MFMATALYLAQIGKELLMAEFPLRLRLIGLRVTKLKDLRTSNNTGIKRVRLRLDATCNFLTISCQVLRAC